MTFFRPTNQTPMTREEKQSFINEYLAFYRQKAQLAVKPNDFSELNVKLPRSVANEFLDDVGALLLKASKNALSESSEIAMFLSKTALPESLQRCLPDEFRAYCLLLNALKQWVSAESLATDRWLLGRMGRDKLKSAIDTCLVTGEALKKIDLHHPVRDGRPPIPLSHAGHRQIETATEGEPDDPTMKVLGPLRTQGHRSWKALRDGCLSHMGEVIDTRTRSSLSNARTFASNAEKVTGKNYEDLIEWLDDNQLGL